MRNDFNANVLEITCIVNSEIVPEPFMTRNKMQSEVCRFTVRTCDLVQTVVPMIVYGDYAQKVKEYVHKGCKCTIWACAHTFKGVLVFKVSKIVLEAYPKDEMNNG